MIWKMVQELPLSPTGWITESCTIGKILGKTDPLVQRSPSFGGAVVTGACQLPRLN
jgi:hypothetical protein